MATTEPSIPTEPVRPDSPAAAAERVAPAAVAIGSALDALLGRELGRIRRRFFVHGLAYVLAALALGFLVYYLADRGLRLPALVRVVCSLAAVAWVAWMARRRLLYPLRRQLTRDDVAVAIERRFPDLHERLISAVQLKTALAEPEQLRNQSPAMIARLLREAEAQVRAVPLAQLLQTKRTLRVWGVAGALLAGVLAAVVADPHAVSVFVQRLAGADVPYPRRTTLHVELPASGPGASVTTADGEATVTLAAGGDLPVLVRAEGEVPRDVWLVVQGGRGLPPQVAMTPRGDVFRHVFRRIGSEFSFHARGGDDDAGDLVVRVVTVRPPHVATIRATLQYPEYTRLQAVTQTGGTVEAVEGTRVKLHVAATAEVAEASLRFLESGQRLPLAHAVLEDDSGRQEVWSGEFTMMRSDRYEVDLLSREGLRNPHPGTYSVLVLPDHAPIGRVLHPLDDAMNVVVPEAVVPVRLEVRDDFGLTDVSLLLRVGKAPEPVRRSVLQAAPAGQSPVLRTMITDVLELAQLGEGAPRAAVGDALDLVVELSDNRSPEPSVTKLSPRQLHVVDEAHLRRRIAGQFRRLREDVDAVLGLQRECHERARELIAELGGDARDLQAGLTAAQVTQVRVQSAGERVHESLMRLFDVHVFNRLDDSIHAPRVLEAWIDYHRRHADEQETFLPGFYREVSRARNEGRLGAMEKTLDPILGMTMRADRVATELAPAAAKRLGAALVAAGDEAVRTELQQALTLQESVLQELEALLAGLYDWNDFQDVVTHTRSILEKQREVEARTRRAMEGKDR